MGPLVNRRFRYWWIFLIRGLLFLLLGVYMLASPAESFAALGFLLGFIVLLAGIGELARIISDRDAASRGWHLILGIIDVLLGIMLIGHLAASELVLRIIVGAWILFRGLSMLSFSSLTGRSWTLVAGGILIVLFALLILFNPVFGAVTIVLWTGFALIITGIFNIWLGFLLK